MMLNPGRFWQIFASCAGFCKTRQILPEFGGFGGQFEFPKMSNDWLDFIFLFVGLHFLRTLILENQKIYHKSQHMLTGYERFH